MTTTANAQSKRNEPLSYFTQRCLAWLSLAGVGNLAVLGVPFALAQAPVGISWDSALSVIGSFALPAYSPALLFFTVILAVLERGSAPGTYDPGDQAQANRMVANGIRLALTVVMSFAILVVILQPTALVQVLFAVLLGFIAIVRAELIAPPKKSDAETIYRRTLIAQESAERWASQVLGSSWATTAAATRTWPTFLLFFATPTLVPAAGIVAVGYFAWGPAVALSLKFIVMSVVVMFGPVLLVVTWLSTADKSESPRSRGWRAGFFLIMSFFGTAAIASAFLFAGGAFIWIGGIIIGSAVLVGVALRSRKPRLVTELRERVERKWTAKRLTRYQEATDRTRIIWENERIQPPAAVRVLARVFRSFRHAYRLAGSTE